MPNVGVQVDFGCDLALIEIEDSGEVRRYKVGDLFGGIDLTDLGESAEVLDQVERLLIAQIPRCRVIR